MREYQVDCIDAHGATYSIPICAENLSEAQRLAVLAGHEPSNTQFTLNPELLSNSPEGDEVDSFDEAWDKEARSAGRTIVIALIVVLLASGACALLWKFRSKPAVVPATSGQH